MSLKYGFVFPFIEPNLLVQLAGEAEAAGWDGVFVPDCVWGIDPWIMLTAVAMRTERVRIGSMITPVSRRRPWTLAGETATLDLLSKGRVVLPVGLGALDTGFAEFGEVTDRKARAELLDEGLDIITGLWRGQPFNYEGKHYHIKETTFYPPPPPVQKPRIPIWVVGAWQREKSLQRALRYDGLLPAKMKTDGTFDPVITPDDVRAMRAYVDQHRTLKTPFEIVVEGRTSGSREAIKKEAAEKIAPLAEAGITWWLEALWSPPNQPEDIAKHIRQGPPRIG